MGKPALRQVLDILDQEIIWCKDHQPEEDQQNGFINGLVQARYLIQELAIVGGDA